MNEPPPSQILSVMRDVDLMTGFSAFHFTADPARALLGAGRLARPQAPLVVAAWGRPEACEAAGYLRALGALVSPPPRDPFAHSGPGALEELAARGGFTPGARSAVLCV